MLCRKESQEWIFLLLKRWFSMKYTYIAIILFIMVLIGCSSSPSDSFMGFKSSILKKDYDKAWTYIDDSVNSSLYLRGISSKEDFHDYISYLLKNSERHLQLETANILDEKIYDGKAYITIEFSLDNTGEKKTDRILLVKRGMFWKILI